MVVTFSDLRPDGRPAAAFAAVRGQQIVPSAAKVRGDDDAVEIADLISEGIPHQRQ